MGQVRRLVQTAFYSFPGRWTDDQTYRQTAGQMDRHNIPTHQICLNLFLVAKNIIFSFSSLWSHPPSTFLPPPLSSFLLRPGLAMQPRMTTHLQSSYLSLPSAKVTGVPTHTQPAFSKTIFFSLFSQAVLKGLFLFFIFKEDSKTAKNKNSSILILMFASSVYSVQWPKKKNASPGQILCLC